MKNKILIIISFLAGALLFNSCLKDKYGEDWTSSLKGKMYAQIVNPGLQSSSITNVATDQTLRVFVNIATDAVPTSDITVTLGIDAAALTKYNADNGTSLVFCPNATIAPVTIKAGTRNGYAYITLKSANLLSMDKAYAIPVSITAVNNPSVIIASNFKTSIIQVPISNPWEGTYTLSSFVLRAGDNALSGHFGGVDWKLVTYGAKSVSYQKLHTWGDQKTGISGIGNFLLTIDDSKIPMPVTVTDLGTSTTSPNATFKNRPGYNNRYDPATKTFYIGVTWSTAGTREITDTLVYKGKL